MMNEDDLIRLYKLIRNREYERAWRIICDDSLQGDEHMEDYPSDSLLSRVFGHYEEYVSSGFSVPELLELSFRSLLVSANNLNFDCDNEASFIGALCALNFSLPEINSLIERGAKPVNTEENFYRGFVRPIMTSDLPPVDKKRYFFFGKEKFETLFLTSNLEKAFVDLILDSQQNPLWDWVSQEDEFKSYNGDRFKADVEMLMEMGVGIDARAGFGHTALMRASMQEMPEAVEFLLSKGASVNLQQDQGNTALMYVSGYLPDTSPMNEEWLELPAHLQIAKILVNAGADISIENQRGDTAIDLARRNKNSAVLAYLESQT